MASRPWSARELAVLELHVDEPNWLESVSAKITGRSIMALKVKMAKLRSSLGLGDGRHQRNCGELDMEEFNAKAVIASQALLAAIQRAGVRP